MHPKIKMILTRIVTFKETNQLLSISKSRVRPKTCIYGKFRGEFWVRPLSKSAWEADKVGHEVVWKWYRKFLKTHIQIINFIGENYYEDAEPNIGCYANISETIDVYYGHIIIEILIKKTIEF